MSNQFDESNVIRDSGGKFDGWVGKREDPGQILDLWSDDEGSFEFPPFPRDKQHLLSFWSKVQIPESTIVFFNHQAQKLRKRDEQALMDTYSLQYPEPVRKNYKTDEEFKTAASNWNAGVDKTIEYAIEDGYMCKVPTKHNIRAVIKAACIYREAANLDSSECASVRNTELALPGGEKTTPERVWREYGMSRLADTLINPDSRTATNMNDMVNATYANNKLLGQSAADMQAVKYMAEDDQAIREMNGY